MGKGKNWSTGKKLTTAKGNGQSVWERVGARVRVRTRAWVRNGALLSNGKRVW